MIYIRAFYALFSLQTCTLLTVSVIQLFSYTSITQHTHSMILKTRHNAVYFYLIHAIIIIARNQEVMLVLDSENCKILGYMAMVPCAQVQSRIKIRLHISVIHMSSLSDDPEKRSTIELDKNVLCFCQQHNKICISKKTQHVKRTLPEHSQYRISHCRSP